ncbi:MAG: tetratricopeptide repeat protein, partial [Flammeovirgaceae bacterium]
MTTRQHKCLLLFLVLFASWLSPQFIFGQHKLDSLFDQLPHSTIYESRALFAKIKEYSPPRHSISEAAVLQLLNRIETSVKGKPQVTRYLAQLTKLVLQGKYFNKVDLEEALHLYQDVKATGHTLAIADAASFIGRRIMYTYNKKKAAALNYSLEALLIYDSLGFVEDAAECNYQVAMLHYWGDNLKTSKIYLSKLMEGDLNYLTPRIQISIINTVGLIAEREKQYELAIKSFEKAIQLATTYKDTIWIGIAKGNIGDVYLLQGDYQQAIPLLKEDLAYSQKFLEYNNSITTLNQLGNIAIKENKTHQAYRYYEEALKIIENHRSKCRLDVIIRTYKNLAMVNNQLGNHQKAFEFLETSFIWQDSLFQINKESEILDIQLHHDFEKKEKEVISLKKERELTAKNQQLKLWVAMVGGGILTIAFVYIWISYHKEKNINLLLNKKNEEISQQKQQIEAQSHAIHSKNNELIKREGVFQELLEALVVDEQKIKSQNQKLQFDKEQLIEQVTHRTHELVIKNKELIQNNTQLEQFNYVIAHNIRGPVARLLGLFQLYENSTTEDEKRMLWPKIKRSANDIDIVIKDLNTTLRIKNNINEVYEAVDLKLIIDRTF